LAGDYVLAWSSCSVFYPKSNKIKGFVCLSKIGTGLANKVHMTKDICNKSVLVVDDDARMLRALDKVLTGEGLQVTCAEWAGDAVEILTVRRNQIDLVITDLCMPLFSGVTLVYAIRQIYPTLPVIVLTAFGSPEVRQECLRQGAAALLEKPLDSEQLIGVVKRVLSENESSVVITSLPADAQEAGLNPKTMGDKVQLKKGRNAYEYKQ
jgi:DNA-binding NtrC family response regulator